MTGNEIRKLFIDYFAEKEHRPVRSSPLVPLNDPTLLFTNAGMVQFKDTFTGLERRDYIRATSSQKCLRVSGKHNDLENVGRTARHHTFFEMLGNFSFGDYFKEKAIEFAWEFLVDRSGLDGERMWITIFREDDEAGELWQRIVGVPAERIIRCDEKDNFWSMGDTGPCGPCSELIYDQGDHLSGGLPGSGQDEDGDRYLELWNLVFMQFDRDASGTMNPLPKPSVDTGMGLERLAAVLQGENSNFHTDLLMPVIHHVEELCEKTYGGKQKNSPDPAADVSFRVIADHVRSVSFLVADGILPSNEGRGYVLRRVARRALRHGRMLGITEPFLFKTAGVVADMMGDAFPELRENLNYISRVTLGEEERFAHTLSQGQPRMDELCEKAKASSGGTVSGDEVFELYDTYGYPWDLAAETATFHGLKIDRTAFDSSMEQQRERARAHWKGSGEAGVSPVWHEIRKAHGPTNFLGYGESRSESEVAVIVREGVKISSAAEGEEAEVFLPKTPFYAESGGQEGDHGRLTWEGGAAVILDTQKPLPDVYVHHVQVEQGTLQTGQTVDAAIDTERRASLQLNHTATHILQFALRQVLGDHVKQAGSHLSKERLRFDFTHFTQITPREKERIEDIVNTRIRENAPVSTEVMSIDKALESGATALFGERYGEEVRVVSVGEFSQELCGGTHTGAAGDIGMFRILHEGSISSGVRRIEAATGANSLAQARLEQNTLAEITEMTKSAPLEEADRVRRIIEQNRSLERELKQIRDKQSQADVGDLASDAQEVNGLKVIATRRDGIEPGGLRNLIDAAKNKLKSGVAVIISASDGKVSIAVGVTKDITDKCHAGNLVKELAVIVGGKGGGRPDFAQAGGKEVGKVDEALAAVPGIIEKLS
ncbi:MAG: alanine--tRNA ligase [Nitrospinaceae bacterium]|jgi:alanyl-tRNA synthetase|nr:alanine--tRNA ligase [Nitrospinaceae bacterium]MBT3433296.1 alanine--tRNA ligase [Nitrospinaceae bacterium]MBT3821842.1 alanine--tRNA ligase [Nitrospinaceae bacterium]MBT4092919.1 alanine--tRNA ligase [Nitrospinaceae bacterium]MBT4429590.1 alanine--tRNA ligase [Nitrospinaceae bacterium]